MNEDERSLPPTGVLFDVTASRLAATIRTEDLPKDYSVATVIVRMVDGVGYLSRIKWAGFQTLTDEDGVRGLFLVLSDERRCVWGNERVWK